jgi:plastocyanin
MRTFKVLAAVGILAAAGVACSGSDNGGAIQTPPPSSSSPAANAVKVNATKDIKFLPAAVTAKVGQPIVWTVVGAVPHDVKASSGATFNSGTLNEGQTFTQTFSTPGTIKYFCTIHGPALMSGTITVTS